MTKLIHKEKCICMPNNFVPKRGCPVHDTYPSPEARCNHEWARKLSRKMIDAFPSHCEHTIGQEIVVNNKSYFRGICRDCWLERCEELLITENSSPEARVDWEKIYEPWIIGLNKATLELGCFRTYAEAQDRLDNFIMNNMTTATLCSSGITEKILYKAAFEKGREAR
jgi:hypothetical protein